MTTQRVEVDQLPSPLDVPLDDPGIPDDVAYLGAKLDRLAAAAEALGSQRDEPAANIRVFVAGVPQVWSVRTRIKLIRMVNDASATITMTIGSATYILRVRVDSDNLYPLPFIIEPGIALQFDGSASPVFRVYVVAYPEPERPFHT